jgi:hypothetical protein
VIRPGDYDADDECAYRCGEADLGRKDCEYKAEAEEQYWK